MKQHVTVTVRWERGVNWNGAAIVKLHRSPFICIKTRGYFCALRVNNVHYVHCRRYGTLLSHTYHMIAPMNWKFWWFCIQKFRDPQLLLWSDRRMRTACKVETCDPRKCDRIWVQPKSQLQNWAGVPVRGIAQNLGMFQKFSSELKK